MRHPSELQQAGGIGGSLLARLTAQRSDKHVDAEPKCGTCTDGHGWLYPAVEAGAPVAVVRCPECESRRRGQAPGVPVAEHGSLLANFTRTKHNARALQLAADWLKSDTGDLYLYGGVGTGKTRLACSLANERWAAGQRVEFFRSANLLTVLLPGSDSLDTMLAGVQKTPVVVLDDIGASQATDFARRMLLVMYEARMDRGLRTIWTSNLDLDELATFTKDDRLPSRIAGNATVVEMSGEDWRLKKARTR